MFKNYNKYLTVSELDERWGLYVTTVGYSKIDINKNYPDNTEHPSDHSFTWNKGRMLHGYYIVFISRGRGIFESEKTSPRSISAGTSFFLFPGIWHRYKPDQDSGWEEYWVGLNGSYARQLMNTGFFNPVTPFVEVGLKEDLLLLFQELLETVQSAKNGYPQIASGITLQILGLIHSLSLQEQHDDNRIENLISKAKFVLQESLERPINMESLAKELPLGYSLFRKSFKTITGTSPHQYHLNLRLQKAKELFTSTNLSISEIAYKTGFDSLFYFSKLFKKKNGVSPKHYRSKNR